jgi:hypothetical protein
MTTNFVTPNQAIYPQQVPATFRKEASRPATEVNAVKIELIEPKAFNIPENAAYAQGFYNYPQASMYSPEPVNAMPMGYPYAQQIPAQYVTPQAPAMPQPMPMPPAAQPVEVPPAVVSQPQPPVAAQPQTPEVANNPAAPAQPTSAGGVDVSKFTQDLGSENLETQFNTINKIAELAQSKTPDALNLLSVDMFKALSSVIGKDTASLGGPSADQTALREKALSGKTLTPEEQAKAEQLAPQEIAEMNKQYALYTLAILQNSYREAVNEELKKQNMQPAKINELPEINLVLENIKNNPNALIREAGISALSYVIKPEDKEVAKTVFTLALKDGDENVRKAAVDAIGKIITPEDKDLASAISEAAAKDASANVKKAATEVSNKITVK